MTKKEEILAEKKLTAKKIILASFFVDLFDVLATFFLAVVSGSIVMMTRALEGVSDLTASAFLLLGFRRSMRVEDKTHPFGYGRELYFWTLMSALVMFGVTATVSIYMGLKRIQQPAELHDVHLALVVLILTVVTNSYAFVLSFRRLLRQRSFKHIIQIFYRSSLVETKTTFILDLMGGIASIVSIAALGIYVLTGDQRFDGYGAVAIGIVLAILSFFLLAGIRDLLVGRSASEETEGRIAHAAKEIEGVDEVLDIKTLHIGSEKLLVNLDVHMQGKLKTRELEKLIDRIKERIQKEVPSVKYIQVELETPERQVTVS